MKVWRLIVWGVSPEHSGLMARFKMLPAKDKPTTFWREYPQQGRSQVENAIAIMRACGLHGIAKKGEKQHRKHYPKTRLATSREGFGGALNARPIAGAWRRKTRHK
jgi:hypothetical protein